MIEKGSRWPWIVSKLIVKLVIRYFVAIEYYFCFFLLLQLMSIILSNKKKFTCLTLTK